jgi:hypothetical protein
MNDPADLRDSENFTGGFYELAIELASGSDDRLDRVLDVLWRCAGIDGCFRRLPGPLEAVPRTLASLEGDSHLYGVVLLPSGRRTVCGVVAIPDCEGGIDWLDFYVPIGALAQIEPRIAGFPFGDDGGPTSLSWRAAIDDWLVNIARDVYAEVPFRLALVGFEVLGDFHSKELEQQGVPDARGCAYVLPDRDGGVRVCPANR